MISELSAEGVHELNWFKSSYSSNSSEADCIEVAPAADRIRVRDSKSAAGPHLGFTPTTWKAFVTYTSER
ncbi:MULTISPECIES: DUF397 domain-containing protein [Streptomyces]|uniref:DUF397 domain-containing protein n=1 Tax=Streptomyces clavifer TaxID=68188 RepID=A0ABS4VD81_9ACTN|nr:MULTISPECIES: DUF397 domain-containing protein [Streptomyces]MBP2361733.1 hypothetical protein [Streptomyces clavifer]MDX2743893.1 DUF397 domain-containing protein [Streptomyces sp. NRRL_B-2557]GHB23604.1 hypothetical protein GCM10010392_59950 [Streptomyces clavifer]